MLFAKVVRSFVDIGCRPVNLSTPGQHVVRVDCPLCGECSSCEIREVRDQVAILVDLGTSCGCSPEKVMECVSLNRELSK